jgi:hypothetical protein
MTTQSKPRWRAFLPLIVVVGLWLLWSIWWAIAYFGAQRIYAREAPRLAEKGIELACSKQTWGGYPFRFEMICEEPRLTVARGTNEFNVSAGRLAVIVQAYYLRHAIALLDGPTDIEGDRIQPVHAEHGRAAFSLRLTSDGDYSFGAEIPKLTVDGKYAMERLVANASGNIDSDATVAAQAEKALLQVTRFVPLKFDTAAAEVKVPSILLKPGGMDAAGTPENQISVEKLAIQKGPLTITGKGTVGLDANRRVQGTLATIVSDLTPLVEEAKTIFGVNDSDSQTAAMMIKLLNAGKTVNIPANLSLKDGTIFWEKIKIAEVPALAFALGP